MTNWASYLSISPKDYNCWTFIEKIHKDKIGIWTPELEKLYSELKTRWGSKINVDQLSYIAQNNQGIQVSLAEVKEYDILVFSFPSGRPYHFGLYIGKNQFIHLRHYPKIDDLNGEWRNKLKAIYRHDNRTKI